MQRRMRQRAELALVPVLRQEFARAGKEFAALYLEHASLQRARLAHRERLAFILRPLFLSLALGSARRISDGAKLRKEAPQKPNDDQPKPVKRPVDLTRQEIEALVVALAIAQATDISGATQRKVQKAIVDGIAQDLDSDVIAKLIEERTGGEIAGARATSIARTAVTQVAEAAQSQAALKAGLQTKVWFTAHDERVRDSHREAEGQVRPLGEDFEVGNSRLAFPGDPLGPIEEIINCRCVLLYRDE